jgi:hypothetical protein
MSTSIVIPLGYGSRWNNLELRYCLRSIEKYLIGYGDVFIVGEKPGWVKNVEHIPCPDYGTQTYDKERNIFNKVIAACVDKRVSDDFLFMNDDHYLREKYEARVFPYYYDGRLTDKMTVTDYKYTVWNTIDSLRPFGRDGLYFDVHCPIVYNKEKFFWCLCDADWTKRFGYCIKTFYCNCVDGLHIIQCKDLKIDAQYLEPQITQMIKGRSWFSIGDKAFDGDIRQVLQELYPNKSKYE